MNLLQALRSFFQSKASQARIAMSVERLGQPVNTPSNYLSFSKEGYGKNAVVYRCISMIARNCAGIEWCLYSKNGKQETEIEVHPLLTLMGKPNPLMGWSTFYEQFISYLCISGNSYVESVAPSDNKPPLELWPLRPDLMKVIPNQFGYPGKYQFKFQGREKYWDVDFVTGKSPIMHMKTFNPVDIWYGMSPMEAAIMGVDQYNQANRWNLALLQNSASPSGVLKVETSDANPGGSITNEQYLRLKQEFEEQHQQAKNAGRPLILEGGVTWQSIALSPKEMEWLNGREVTAQDICNVYGVPAQMLGIGDTTYSNYKEARQSFFEETILPIMDSVQYELNNWLTPKFGDNLYLKYDKDDIEVLVEKREAKFSALVSANWLTQNEKRTASGYQPQDGWDVFVIGNQILETPDQWTTMNPTDPVEPDPEEGENEDGEETNEAQERQQTETSTEEVTDEEQEKGWKTFNLLNRNEKSNTWRRVNARRKRLESPFARSLEQDFDELAREMAKALKGKDPKLAEFALHQVIDSSMKDIAKTINRHLKFTVEDFGSAVFQNSKSQLKMLETKASERTWHDWAERFVKSRTATAISQIEGTTRKQVRRVVQNLVSEALQEDADINVARELRNEFSELSKARALTIARTEVAMAANSATLEAVKSLEIPGMKKEWVSLQDDRTRDGGTSGVDANHLDMDGVRVELDDKFTVPPDASMEGPGDPSGGADQVCNCRCTLVFNTGVR